MVPAVLRVVCLILALLSPGEAMWGGIDKGKGGGGKGKGDAQSEWTLGYRAGIAEGLRRAAAAASNLWHHQIHVVGGPPGSVAGDGQQHDDLPHIFLPGAPEAAVTLLQQMTSSETLDRIDQVLARLENLNIGEEAAAAAAAAASAAAAAAAAVDDEPPWDLQPDGTWWCHQHNGGLGEFVNTDRFGNNQARNRAKKRKCSDCANL